MLTTSSTGSFPRPDQNSFSRDDAADILLRLGQAMSTRQTTTCSLAPNFTNSLSQPAFDTDYQPKSISSPKRRKCEVVGEFDSLAASFLAEFDLTSYNPSLQIPLPPTVHTPSSDVVHELQCRATSLVAQLRMLFQLRGLLIAANQSPLFPSANTNQPQPDPRSSKGHKAHK